MRRLISAFAALVLFTAAAHAQSTPFQGGAWTAGRAPMYVGNNFSQPVLQDSGPAAGGGPGLGLSEQLLVARGSGLQAPPYVNAGSGPLGANWCDYDAPTTSPAGYHYICISPNSNGQQTIAVGSGGGATTGGLTLNVNGQSFTLPFNTAIAGAQVGGDLTGALPNPVVGPGAISSSKLAAGAALGNLLPLSIGSTLLAPGAAISNLNNASSNTLTGNLALPSFAATSGSTVIDNYDSPPVNGIYGASGPYVSVNSSGGHVPGDSMRASLALPTTTLYGPERQESAFWLDLRSPVGTGAVNSYLPSTSYNTGEFVQSNDASQIYKVTQGGTSAASSGGPNFCPVVNSGGFTNVNQCIASTPVNASTGSDGTMQLAYYGPGANNGKSAILVSHEVNGGAHAWLGAYDLIVNSLPRIGGSAVNNEIDTQDNVRDCPPFVAGGCSVTAMWINGGDVNYPGSFGLWINGGSSSNAAGSFHVGEYISPNSAIDVGLWEQSGATIGTRQRGTNATASLLNDATTPVAAFYQGVYSKSVVDTEGAGASTPFWTGIQGQGLVWLNAGTARKLSVTGNVLNYATPSNGSAFYVDDLGDMEFSGVLRPLSAAPTLSACGTSPAMASDSNSTSGTVTVGIGTVTSCQINLAAGYPAATYHCTLTPANATAAGSGVNAYAALADRTTTSWMIRGTALAGAAFNYVCM